MPPSAASNPPAAKRSSDCGTGNVTIAATACSVVGSPASGPGSSEILTRPPSSPIADAFTAVRTTHLSCGSCAASRLGRSVMPFMPRQRAWPSVAGAAAAASIEAAFEKPSHHVATAPASWAAATMPPNAGPRTVKNWAPWSQTASPTLRVAIRPPTPRDFSSTTTRRPLATSSPAADSPAMPAPTTTTSGSNGSGGRLIFVTCWTASGCGGEFSTCRISVPNSTS